MQGLHSRGGYHDTLRRVQNDAVNLFVLAGNRSAQAGQSGVLGVKGITFLQSANGGILDILRGRLI